MPGFLGTRPGGRSTRRCRRGNSGDDRNLHDRHRAHSGVMAGQASGRSCQRRWKPRASIEQATAGLAARQLRLSGAEKEEAERRISLMEQDAAFAISAGAPAIRQLRGQIRREPLVCAPRRERAGHRAIHCGGKGAERTSTRVSCFSASHAAAQRNSPKCWRRDNKKPAGLIPLVSRRGTSRG